MLIERLFDIEKFHSHVAAGTVKMQPSRIWGHIKIYNYGRECQFDNTLWDDVTAQCRGLIVDWDTGEVLARPFRKFFNLGTAWRPETNREHLPTYKPEFTRKMDGSLGILWHYEGEPMIATRGSFGSAQSRWATKFYQKNVRDVFPSGWTPCFEIIYPENRIVVKYDREELVLLGMVNIETGEEMPHQELSLWAERAGVPVVELLDGKGVEEAAKENTANEEGYVVTWHRAGTHPLKLKIKFLEYCRIHRLVTGLSVKGIWESLRAGENLEAEFSDMPQHFKDWADEWIDRLGAKYLSIEEAANEAWESRPDTDDRKALALHFTKFDQPIPGVCFARLDGKETADIIWKACRPAPEEAFHSAVVEV